MLLLLLRRRKLSKSPTSAEIEAFGYELQQSILVLRQKARTEALAYARGLYGLGVEPTGLAGALVDYERSVEYASNATELIRDVKVNGGNVIKAANNRLTTIAVTENSGAYNDEHRRSVVTRASELGLVEVWDATLDKRTCEECFGLDGSIAYDGQFDGGLVPGAVHPYCRCTSHFIRRDWIH